MLSKIKGLLLILLYTLIACGCVWLCHYTSSTPLPSTSEVPHLIATSQLVESHQNSLSSIHKALPPTRPFHRLAALTTTFIGAPLSGEYSLRSYRLLPTFLTAVLLALIPALGLKRRGGFFETNDAPFWVMAFLIASPAVLCFCCRFTPLAFQASTFFLLLVSTRAYVQWPNYLSAMLIGFLAALAVLAEPDFLWAVLLLIPVIGIGLGWRRLALFWHTGHFLTLVATLLFILGVGHFRITDLTLALVNAFQLSEPILYALKWRLIWLCSGGFALLAWLGMLIWRKYNSDHRWERILLILFPIYLLASLFFKDGGGFAIPTICLSALLLAFLLSLVPNFWWKLSLGSITFAVLILCNIHLTSISFDLSGTDRKRQIKALKDLRSALTVTQETSVPFDIAINNPELNAAMHWHLRHYPLSASAQHTKQMLLLSDRSYLDTKTTLKLTQNSVAMQTFHLSANQLLYLFEISRKASTKGNE